MSSIKTHPPCTSLFNLLVSAVFVRYGSIFLKVPHTVCKEKNEDFYGGRGESRVFNPYMYALNDKRGGYAFIGGGILFSRTCALARINMSRKH